MTLKGHEASMKLSNYQREYLIEFLETKKTQLSMALYYLVGSEYKIRQEINILIEAILALKLFLKEAK